jgi:alkanesulfonate monooxygenase SsuD/methylene tetrahydromethanopterin reductase-like flavin-dependent oxidoreductase (luciferase family)
LEEGIEVIQGMWSQDPFSYDGKHNQLKNISLMPKPVQSPPPIWVGARGPKGVARAARMGCHFLGVSDPASQETYDKTLREHGRDPKDYSAAQLRWTYISSSREQAWDECQDHLHYMLDWYSRWATQASDFKEDVQAVTLPPASELRNIDKPLVGGPIIGSPDEVGQELEQMIGSLRTTHLILGMHLPGLDPAKSQRSMELFAKEIMPGLRK